MDSRECGNCGEGFVPSKHNQLYCLQLRQARCEFCSAPFERICGTKTKQTCSKSCSSRLIRRQQAERSTASCVGCGDDFQQKISAQVYCNRLLSVDCEGGCGLQVETACSKSPKRFCTPTCRQLHMRATSYSISIRDCMICGESFVPSGSKAFTCQKDHMRECAWCGNEFSVNFQRWSTEGLGICCDGTCSTLMQTNSRLRKELTAEYKAIDEWALRFRAVNGRKPTGIDARIYFGVNIPVRANESLFRIDGRDGSGFELHVLRAIRENWPELEVLRNKRPLRSESGRILEIDLWIPSLGIGFEVQDFATHSRDSDSELSPMPWSEFKNGPTYHSAKKAAADRAGIELFEIWEDDILTGRTQTILEGAIVAALCASDEVSVP